MKMLNIPLLQEKIECIPVSEGLEAIPKIDRYMYLLDLLGEDYISPEILMVPHEEWHELALFIVDIEDMYDNPKSPEAKTFQHQLQNIKIASRLENLFIQTKTPSSMLDDFV